MKFVQRYITPIFIYLLFILIGFSVVGIVQYLLEAIYEFLVYLFPTVFRTFSKISEPLLYEEYMKWLTIVSVGVVLLLVNYVSLRADNKRFEHMIVLTDGLYRMKDGILLYLREFAVSDIITSLFIPSLVMIPMYFLPESVFERWLSLPFWCYDYLIGYMDIVEATVTLTVLSVLARAAVIHPTVKVWRAMWLTASVD